MAGRDVLGLAQTGTGKTAAFALPILNRLLAGKRGAPRALVLAPTRELAMQIHAEFRMLAKFTRLGATTIYGGVSSRSQIGALRKQPDVLIACPGRLLDLMQQGHVDLGRIEVLVLDEADHMFDIGFLPDIRRILRALPTRRQNLLFSATMPAAIRSLAGECLHEPHVAEFGHSAPAATIDHALYYVPPTRKMELLQHVLTSDATGSAIVFSRTRHRAKRLARQLSGMGYEAIALQGSMSQSQRDRAMDGFRHGRFDVLVATDVAARGIDVAEVARVINFDMPTTPEAYTHRIGRTGRSGHGGRAYTFVCEDDLAAVRALERQLGKPITRRKAPGCDGQVPASRGTTHSGWNEKKPGKRTRAYPAARDRQEDRDLASKLFVGNLAFSTTSDELSELFREFGEIGDVFIPTDRDSGRPRGFAFVEFAEESAAKAAIEKLDGYELGGRNLRVNEAEERSRTPRIRTGFNDDGGGRNGQKRFKPKGSRKNMRARKRGF